jgi:hypothetical protein
MKSSIGSAIFGLVLGLSFLISPAFADDNIQLRAFRQEGSTECNWSNDPFNPTDPMVRLESLAFAGRGNKAALVGSFGDNGQELREFSLEVKQHPHFFYKKNVRPDAVVEYYDESNNLKYLRITYDDFTRKAVLDGRESWTFDLLKKNHGKPMRVRRIAVGGREHHLGKPTNAAPMDVTIARFRARLRTDLPRVYNLDVSITGYYDKIFDDLIGTI